MSAQTFILFGLTTVAMLIVVDLLKRAVAGDPGNGKSENENEHVAGTTTVRLGDIPEFNRRALARAVGEEIFIDQKRGRPRRGTRKVRLIAIEGDGTLVCRNGGAPFRVPPECARAILLRRRMA